jgi:hypothetical protein
VANCNATTFKKSVINMDIQSLPLEPRKSAGFNDFTHKFKLFLLDHPFCTLHEFILEGQE